MTEPISPGSTADTPSKFANPFDPSSDVDRHEIWEMLVARDSEAFVACDWSICEGDFEADRFEGISAQGSLNPVEWSLQYPTLESYRDDWLRMARDYQELPLAGVSHRELLYRMQTFARIEIAGDRAVAWKQFRADESLKNGERHKILGQSVYRLHRVDGRWKIVGFVGYLPLES